MKRYGFNFLWMFSPDKGKPAAPADERGLDFCAAEGFDFARLPLHYHYWAAPGDYRLPAGAPLRLIEGYVAACRQRSIHAVLNLHQAPGYAVSTARQALEVHDLWTDAAAQDAFIAYWRFFAERFRDVPADALSFNPVNEPPSAPWRPTFSRERHADLMRRTIAAVHAIDPDRPILLDGCGGGSEACPELADTGATQCVRGYQPFPLTHYRAEWEKSFASFTEPTWPVTLADGKTFDVEQLVAHYAPWRAMEAAGVDVHVSEFGCYRHTPNDVALAWFRDLIGLYREFGWGWALWNFNGPFGIVEHGRPGARYERRHGLNIDPDLLELVRPPQ